MPHVPLSYLFATNVLSTLLTTTANQGLFKRVFVKEIGEQKTHGQYVDNTVVLIEADRRGIDYLFDTFRQMGLASGLFIKEIGVKATMVPN